MDSLRSASPGAMVAPGLWSIGSLNVFFLVIVSKEFSLLIQDLRLDHPSSQVGARGVEDPVHYSLQEDLVCM